MAEFGSFGPITMGRSAPYEGIGHKISRINMKNGEVSTFISNKSGLPSNISGEGGFGRPVDVKFGPEGAMYILDYGIYNPRMLNQIIPNTGIIWRVTRSS
jgi:glucose/arabinose dehydrogenase